MFFLSLNRTYTSGWPMIKLQPGIRQMLKSACTIWNQPAAGGNLTHKSINTKAMNKRKVIEQEIKTLTVYRIECSFCGDVWDTDFQTLEDFISEIEPDFHIATSQEFKATELICDSCLSDGSVDWVEVETDEPEAMNKARAPHYDKTNIVIRRMKSGQIVAFFPDTYLPGMDQVAMYSNGRFTMQEAELIDQLGMPTYNEYEPLLNELQSLGYNPVILSNTFSAKKIRNAHG